MHLRHTQKIELAAAIKAIRNLKDKLMSKLFKSLKYIIFIIYI